MLQAAALKARAAAYPRHGCSSLINQRESTSALPSTLSSAAGSRGASETLKLASGQESPSPKALMNASLRVQQLKNASVKSLASSARSADTSEGEKKRSATSAQAKSARTY